jgi:hypothetical protein
MSIYRRCSNGKLIFFYLIFAQRMAFKKRIPVAKLEDSVKYSVFTSVIGFTYFFCLNLSD